MITNRKYTLSVLVALSLGMTACTDVEPIKVIAQQSQKETHLAEYKQTKHPMSLTWMSDWSANGAKESYLSNLPDSLDMVVVSGVGDHLDVRQQVDLKNVKSHSALKVLLPFYTSDMIGAYTDQLDEAFDYIAEGHPELDEDKAEDMEQLQKMTQERERTLSEKFAGEVETAFTSLFTKCKTLGLDGMEVELGDVSDNRVQSIILKALVKLGENKDGKLLVIKGNTRYMAAAYPVVDFIIDDSSDIKSVMEMNQAYHAFVDLSGFEPNKYLTYIDMNKGGMLEPFSDMITVAEKPMPRFMFMAQWVPASKGNVGVAVCNQKAEALKDYPYLRQIIQYVVHK